MPIPFWVKLLVLGLVVSAIFGGGFKTGYDKGYASATEDLRKDMDALRVELTQVKTDFSSYKTGQDAKLRKIEEDSAAVALLAQQKALEFKRKADAAQGSYAKLLNDRKEVPSTLSSASFDTINSLVNDWIAETP